MTEPAPFCPYVGLRPFRAEDRPYFFGRERESDAIADHLFGARLTILYGASGVGKSSVLQAGVVPRLADEARTAVVSFRSWQVPQAAEQLKQAVVDATAKAAGRALAIPTAQPLDELLKQAAEALDGTVLLLLDQFEEYFLYFPETADGGFDVELARAITRRDIDAGFLIAMREDSLSKLDRFRKRVPTLFANTLRLSHLSLAAAQRAVEGPLEVYNAQHPDALQGPVAIEPALAQSLLQQVSAGQVSIDQGGGSGRGADSDEQTRVEAPYLQLVLERLWAEETAQGSRRLRLQTLDQLGGAQNIVRTHLDQVMDKCSAADQELCARVFDRLVTPAGAKVACRLGDLESWADDLAPEVRRVTKLLQDAMLLAKIGAPPGHPPEDDQYQIFHDVLAAGVLDWRRRFLQRRENEQAQTLAAQREREAAEERLRAEQSAARERELQAANERAEREREHAAQERRLTRRFRLATLVALVLAAVGIGLAWFANEKSKAAELAAQREVELKSKALAEATAAKKAQAALLLANALDAYAKQHDFDAAIGGVGEVLKLDPDSAPAHEALGRVYLDRGTAYVDPRDIDRAIAEFGLAIGLDPKNAAALAGRAAARQGKGQFAAALADYSAAIEATADSTDTLESKRGSRADNRELSLALMKHSATLAQLYYNRGTAYQAGGELEPAIADYSRAVALRPRWDDAYLAYLARGDLYAKQGQRQAAISDFQLALQSSSDPAAQALATSRLAALGAAPAQGPSSDAIVWIQIVDPKDRELAKAIAADLRQRGYRVDGIEPVPQGRTQGDVRFVAAEQQRTASAIAADVEQLLARNGRKLTMRVLRLDPKQFPKAKPNVIEVWLPALADNLQAPAPKY
jgi:tetratricopeptide (TPR) repeat protein